MNLRGIEGQLTSGNYFNDSERQILERTLAFAEDFDRQKRSSGIIHGSHLVDHWKRVAFGGGQLALMEGQHPFLPIMAGFIHDLGRLALSDSRALTYQHGELSAELVANFVDGLKLSPEEKALALQAVEDHPLRNENVRQTDIVKILMDSDRIDGVGAIGPIRSAAFRYHNPCFLDEISVVEGQPSVYEDLGKNSQYVMMFWTQSARKIAEPRIKFLQEFRAQLREEIDYSDKLRRQFGFN